MTCTQAVSSPLAAAAQLRIEQRIESQNLAQVEIGNATAKQLTVSFWVKSNKTGLFVAELIDPNGSQQVSGSFTIAAANTWERHVVTFPANPTGTIITNNNSFGLAVSFWLVAGSNFTSGTLQTAWGNTAANRAAGFAANSQITGLNDYLQITGVQLEIGITASKYEVLPIQTQLQSCYRYYYQIGPNLNSGQGLTYIGRDVTSIPGIGQALNGVAFFTKMRATPTLLTTATASDYQVAVIDNAGTIAFLTSANLPVISVVTTDSMGQVNINSGGAVAAGSISQIRANNASAYLGFNSEL